MSMNFNNQLFQIMIICNLEKLLIKINQHNLLFFNCICLKEQLHINILTGCSMKNKNIFHGLDPFLNIKKKKKMRISISVCVKLMSKIKENKEIYIYIILMPILEKNRFGQINIREKNSIKRKNTNSKLSKNKKVLNTLS